METQPPYVPEYHDGVLVPKSPRLDKRSNFYIPCVLRIPTLLAVFLFSIALIGIIEYGIRMLPHAEKSKHTYPQAVISSLLHMRQIYGTVMPTPSTNPDAIIETLTFSTTTEVITVVLDTTNPASYIPLVTSTPPASISIPPETVTLRTSTYVLTETLALWTSVYVSPKMPTTMTSAYILTETRTLSVGSHIRAEIPTTITSAYILTETLTLLTSTYISTEMPTTITSAYILTETLTLSTSTYIPTEMPTTMTSTYVPTVSPTGTSQVLVATDVITSVSRSVFATDLAGHISTLITYIPTTLVSTMTVETVVPTGGNNIWGSSSDHFPLWQVFVGNYLALVIAVVFRQIWAAIHTQAKLIEPFTHLMEPQGSSASNILYTFYLSSSMIPDPIIALTKHHWLVLWVSLVHFTVGFLAPLGSELLFLNTKWCVYTNDIPNPCWPPQLSIDPLIAHLLQGLLIFVAIMTLIILAIRFRMRTGVYSDPSAIASIASLLHHPEVLQDFRAFNDKASTKDMQQHLDNKRYKLDDYQRYDGVWRYGLVPVIPSVKAFVQNKPQPIYNLSKSRKQKALDTILDIAFGLVLLALLGIVVGYYKDAKANSFNNFFNSATFGPRFILTGAGTIIATNWRRLERDVHTLSPYRRMAQSPANPRPTILLRDSSIPLISVFTMLFNRHFFASIMAVIAMLADILTIFLGVVPFATGQVFLELLVACFVSIGVLGVMVLSITSLIVWKHCLPNLPLVPKTIGAVGSYVSDSGMLSNFEGCEYLDNRDLANSVVSLGKRYVYGKRLNADGQLRYVVDEETILVQ